MAEFLFRGKKTPQWCTEGIISLYLKPECQASCHLSFHQCAKSVQQMALTNFTEFFFIANVVVIWSCKETGRQTNKQDQTESEKQMGKTQKQRT